MSYNLTELSDMKSWKNLYLQGSFHPSALLVWGTGLCMHCHHSSAQALWSGRAFCPFLVHPSYFSGTQRQAPVCSQRLAKVAAVSKKRWGKKKKKQTTNSNRKNKEPQMLKYKSIKIRTQIWRTHGAGRRRNRGTRFLKRDLFTVSAGCLRVKFLVV